MKAMPTLWLLGAWSWYLHSLLRKVHAEPRLSFTFQSLPRKVKAGLIVEKAVGLNRQWVPERAVTEAPIMARSAAWAYASAGCLWLGHLTLGITPIVYPIADMGLGSHPRHGGLMFVVLLGPGSAWMCYPGMVAFPSCGFRATSTLVS